MTRPGVCWVSEGCRRLVPSAGEHDSAGSRLLQAGSVFGDPSAGVEGQDAPRDQRSPEQAQEQLRQLGVQTDIDVLPIIAGQSPTDIASRAVQAAKLGGHDVVILDTAGRTHIDEPLMVEMADIKKNAAWTDMYKVVFSKATCEHAGTPDRNGKFRAVAKEINLIIPNDHMDVCIITPGSTYHTAYESGFETDWGKMSAALIANSPIRDLLTGKVAASQSIRPANGTRWSSLRPSLSCTCVVDRWPPTVSMASLRSPVRLACP